ncbi:uncharacterized protein LOC143296415 [Babylonia areolata]|uniref:uncharacterized protein LOC143296415 n=1 Tax=Babylonia areolata TaxID=304850 RepID=UPI003FD076DA
MATAEPVCESNVETEFTSPTITSDQPPVLSISSPNHTPTTVTPPSPTVVAEHAPISTQVTETIPDTTEPQKDCRVVVDDDATPQVCQQVEIVTEQANSAEPCFPKIDAVWSIRQEHSYEQKVHRRTENKGSNTPPTRPPPEPVQDCPSGTRSMETQHTPTLPQPQAAGTGTEGHKVRGVHMPQILKIHNKPNKTYFIHDSPDSGSSKPKYLNMHGGKSQPVAKSYKTLKVLQLPSHSSSHSSWNSCLIDHNLKPLQIQHNLEHKNKALAVLKLETLSLKYHDDCEDSAHYFHPQPPPSPESPFSERECKGNVVMDAVGVGGPDTRHGEEEVGMDAVYVDVDSDPRSNPDFMDSSRQEEGGEGEDGGWVEEEGSVHSLSMDHYLPDFTDLPPFHNIPIDQPDDQYTEPTLLTPSIHHNLFDYDWPPPYPPWNQHTPPSAFPTPVVAVPASASTSTLPTPTAVPPSPLPSHSPLMPILDSTALDQLVDTTPHHGQTTASQLADSAAEPGTATPLSGAGSSTTTPFSAVSMLDVNSAGPPLTTTTATNDLPLRASIKTEVQSTWTDPVENTPSPTATPTILQSQPVSGDSCLPTDSAISTALMTAFDLDSHQPSGPTDSHTSTSKSHVPFPYPDHPYSDAPYPDMAYTEHPYCDPPSQGYGEGGGGGSMGCSSSFLSPPPSVEPQASQRSTPCPDESGYLTMEDPDLQSPATLYWPHRQPPPPHHHHHHHHFPPSSSQEDMDNSYNTVNTGYPATVTSGYVEGGGYPYTHQDSHYQTLNQTASTATINSSGSSSSSDIIYYPFNDLMQLNPSLLGSDCDMSVQYVHPHPYPQHTMSDSCSDSGLSTPYLDQGAAGRRRGRGGGRPRGGGVGGGRQCPSGQIQSDQISSSLHRQLQAQMAAPPKRQYRRRNPDGRRKSSSSLSRLPRCGGVLEGGGVGGERKGRHNEPLNQKAVDMMYEWYRQHEDNPYPTKEEKEMMALEGGITTMQVKSWFANKRNRSNNTRPKVQKRAMEEKLMQIYNQLSKTEGASVQEGGNSFIIKELSQIIHNKLEPDNPTTTESAT